MILAADSSAPSYGAGTLKTIALVIFFGFFVGLLLRLLFSRSERYRKAAMLPLDDEQARDDGRDANGKQEHGD